jgi:type II secretory pathway component PulF
VFGKNFLEVASTYHSLSAMAGAGVDMVAMLSFQAKTGREPALAGRLLWRVEHGATLAAAMHAEHFSRLDCSMINAAEETGEFVKVTNQLSEYYRDRYDIERSLKFALLKPSVMFFVSLVTSAIVPFFMGRIGVGGLLLRTVLPMVLLLAVFKFCFELFWQASRKRALDDSLDRFIARFRVTRALTESMARERFFVAFLICVKAGTSLSVMTKIFKDVADHPSLHGAHVAFDTIVEKKGFADAMEASGVFTDSEIAGVRVGEISGRLENQLETIVRELRVQMEMRLAVFKVWAPRLIYGAVGCFVFLNMFF